jgi:class 3 adenylate cyclase
MESSTPGPGQGPLPEGTVVILFLDVADSTALTEQLGDSAFRSRASKLDAVLRQAIIDTGGIPVEGKVLGDGVMALFRSARQAIECAGHCKAAGDEAELPLHLGIHAGDVTREGNTVYGGAVNLAQRVTDRSLPGQILVSDVVRGLARTSTDVAFRDLGAHVLKGVSEAVRLFEVCGPEEDVDSSEVSQAQTGSLQAILFTDVVGWGQLTQRLGDQGVAELLRVHDAVVRGAMQAFGGTEIRHLGDGILASFSSATGAVDCCIGVQKDFEAYNRSAREPLHVRAGLHAGEAIMDAREVAGTAVSVAGRLCVHALGGQILSSEAVIHMATDRRHLFSFRGEMSVEGVDIPVRVYEIRWRGDV